MADAVLQRPEIAVDSSSTYSKPAAGLAVRRGVFAALLVVTLVATQMVDLPGDVSVVVVPFVLALGLNLLPAFWSREPDPFEPATFNGLYGALGLSASLVSILSLGRVDLHWLPELSPRAKEELAATVVWSYVIAQVCYLVGYYWPQRSRPGLSRFANIGWSESRLLFACVVCMAFAVPVYAWFQARVGADLTDLTQLAKGKAVWRDDPTQTWILRGMMLGFLPGMLLLAWAIEQKRATMLLVVCAFIFIEGMLVLRAGQRGLTLGFFATCAGIYHYMRRKIPMAFVAAAVLVGLIVANGLLQYRVQEAEYVRLDPLRERATAERILRDHETDRQRLSTLAVVYYHFPDKQEFLYGQSWAGLVALPVPRWLWPGKVDAFIWRDTNIVKHLVGAPVPTPYHGVLYANFSWVGVVLGMALWGAFQRRLYHWAMAARGDKSVTLLYVNALFIMSPTLLPLIQLTQYVLPLLAILLFIGYRRLPRAVKGAELGHV